MRRVLFPVGGIGKGIGRAFRLGGFGTGNGRWIAVPHVFQHPNLHSGRLPILQHVFVGEQRRTTQQ